MTTFTTQDREDAEKMNANELAEFIKTISEYREFDGRTYCQECFKATQDMLLQQQSEIEKMKERNQFLESFYRTVKAQSK
jgi:hypothetical protein